MTRWYYKSIFDELEDMRSYMDSLFREVSEPGRMALLPAAGAMPPKMLTAQKGTLRVDVVEHDNEVIVTADMIPGISKEDISLDLINPQALEITAERKDEKQEEKEGYYMRERSFGSMARIVPLPKAVTEDGATASFRNGVLEVHLKKLGREPRAKISIN
jgi:HSP20 family protein